MKKVKCSICGKQFNTDTRRKKCFKCTGEIQPVIKRRCKGCETYFATDLSVKVFCSSKCSSRYYNLNQKSNKSKTFPPKKPKKKIERDKKFPYTKITEYYLCIWHYSDGGYDRMKLDKNYSIFGRVPNYQIEELVEQCMADGRYNLYVKYYCSMRKVLREMPFQGSKIVSGLGDLCV